MYEEENYISRLYVKAKLDSLLEEYVTHRKQVPVKNETCEECKRISDSALNLYKSKSLSHPEDAFRAAFLLQHGVEIEYIRAANELARYSMERLDKSYKYFDLAKWLCAASYDRILVKEGRPQKFGTQFRLNGKGEPELAAPICPATTDKEREEYGVPPIAEIMARLAKTE